MYVAAVFTPDYLNTSMASGVTHVLSMVLCALSPDICLRKLIWLPYINLDITSNTAYDSAPNKRTACTTAR